MLSCCKPSVVVRPAVYDLAVLGHVLSPGAHGMLDDAQASVEHGAHLVVFSIYEFGNQLPAFERVRLFGTRRTRLAKADDPTQWASASQIAHAAKLSDSTGLLDSGIAGGLNVVAPAY